MNGVPCDDRVRGADPYEAKTRELPRPKRPTVPEGWSYDSVLEAWVYAGRLADAVLEEPGLDDLEADLERVEAELALLKYLRADRAHQSRGVRDGASPALQADPNRSGEFLEWAARESPPSDGRAHSSLYEAESVIGPGLRP